MRTDPYYGGFTIFFGNEEVPYAEGLRLQRAEKRHERNKTAPVKQSSNRKQDLFRKMRARQTRHKEPQT